MNHDLIRQIIKDTFFYILSFLFFTFGILTILEAGWLSGIVALALAIILFPYVRNNYLPETLKGSWAVIGCVFLSLVLVGFFSNEDEIKASKLAEQQATIESAKKAELEKQILAFQTNPSEVIESIKSLIEKKKYSEAREKINTLKVTHDSELNTLDKKLFDIEKEIKEERQKEEQKQLERQAIKKSQKLWSYSINDDPMSTGKIYYASIQSSNTVHFSFPYSGAQHGELVLRTHPKHGKDVIFSIERGQILCPSYDNCIVRARFDDGDPVSYTAVGAADNSTETIFIQNYSAFVGRLMRAKRVRISANIYQQGAPVFEFDVSGFDVKQYKPQK